MLCNVMLQMDGWMDGWIVLHIWYVWYVWIDAMYSDGHRLRTLFGKNETLKTAEELDT